MAGDGWGPLLRINWEQTITFVQSSVKVRFLTQSKKVGIGQIVNEYPGISATLSAPAG
jgi:hypothetical protein